MIIADTDVLIDFLRKKAPSHDRVAQEIEGGALSTTTINVLELLSGAKRPHDLAQVQTVLGALTILPLDERVAAKAAALRRDLESSGNGLALADCLIAGTCLVHGAQLLTRNRKHFERVPELKLAPL